jgi:hypothetical protein
MAITTVFDVVSGMTNNWSDSNDTIRMVYSPTSWTASPAGADQMRITFQFFGGGTGGYQMGNFWVGQMGATLSDFTGDQVQVKFSGANTFASPTGAVGIVSDWVTLPQNFDSSKSYVVSFHIPNIGGNMGGALGFGTGTTAGAKNGATDVSGVTSVTPLDNSSPGYVLGIAKIEVQSSPPVTVGLTAAGYAVGSPIMLGPELRGPLVLGTVVIDGGLGLFALANKIVLCRQMPTTYAEANTYTIGAKNFGIGNAFGVPSAGTGGRKVVSSAIIDGVMSATGVPVCWAVLDDVNSRLLLAGPLTGATTMNSGALFSLGSFTVTLPSALS